MIEWGEGGGGGGGGSSKGAKKSYTIAPYSENACKWHIT